MFFEPTETQFDLRWRMFGIPVRVHPWFWLVTLIMGWNLLQWGNQGNKVLFLWVVCVFVSILVHELGHVFMGRVFGADSHVVLYGFGGLAVGANSMRSRWQRIAVCLAGPGAGFLLYGVVFAITSLVEQENLNPLARATVEFMKWINLFWGFVNLLPVWPLDGGQISRDLCTWIWPANGSRIALGLSIVVAGGVALNGVLIHQTDHPLPLLEWIPHIEAMGDWFVILLFAMLAFNSFQALQVEARRKPWEREDEDW